MFQSPEQLSAQLTALTESNEQLLKSKSRLQQDLLTVKKELAAKEQELLRQRMLVQQQELTLAEQERLILFLQQVKTEHEEQLTHLNRQLSDMEEERGRLEKRSWFQRVFGSSRR